MTGKEVDFSRPRPGGYWETADDYYLAKYDSEGNNIFEVRRYASSTWPQGVTVDDVENIWVTGGQRRPDPPDPHNPVRDLFIDKFSTDGDLIFNKVFGKPTDPNGHSHGRSIAVDYQGNVWVTGRGSGYLNLDDGNIGTPNYGDDFSFVAKFDSDGNPIWSMQIDPIITAIEDMAFDAAGDAYVFGYRDEQSFGDR